MPTYDYICENCQYEFEQFQPITAKPHRKCPKCEKMGLRRLIGSGAAVIFKGSGFYETDYRSEGYKQSQKSEKTTSDSTTKKTETKAETETKDSTADIKPKPIKKDKKR